MSSKKKYVSSSNILRIYCHCAFKNCPIIFHLETDLSIESDVVLFKILSSGTYNSENHPGTKLRYISGAKRAKLASNVCEFGAKVTQNKLINSSDLSKINSENEELKKSLNSLRQMKYEKLAFSDLSSNNTEDILCLKKLTDLKNPSSNDPSPDYIRFIRAINSSYCGIVTRK